MMTNLSGIILLMRMEIGELPVKLCGLLLSIVILALGTTKTNAQNEESTEDNGSMRRSLRAQAEFTLFDVPYNSLGDPRWPSMAQSLNITKSFYELSHAGIEQYLPPTEDGWQGFWNRFGFVAFDVFTMSYPPASAWLHEEWHRAVLGHRGIDSHNGTYAFKNKSTIPVDQLKDEDLRRLKEEHNPEMVRLGAAGMEAEHELAFAIERDHFVQDTRTFDSPALILFKVSPIFYLDACATSASNRTTDDMNIEDGSNVSKRDFTGLDCDAWIYDLNRPDEPYDARGVHPSGVGVDRYRKLDHLDDGEKAYLKLQSRLSLLNMVDPWLFGIEGFGRRSKWNANLRHDLTSFGYSVGLNLFHENSRNRKAITSFHNYRNGVRSFPGIDYQSWSDDDDTSRRFLGSAIDMFRVAMWLQPKSQRFDTDEGTPGALFATRFGLGRIEPVRVYGEFSYKTQGWVSGEVNLDRGADFKLGVASSLL